MTEKAKNVQKIQYNTLPDFFLWITAFTILATVLTPITFQTGVYGIGVLTCWLLYAVCDISLSSEHRVIKAVAIVITLAASSHLLSKAGLFASIVMFTCSSC